MDAIFSWPRLVWAARFLALLVVSGTNIIVLGLLMRLLSPSNLRALARGALPALRRGRFNVMGQELELSAVAETRSEGKVATLTEEAVADRELIDRLAVVVEHLLAKEALSDDECERHERQGASPHAQDEQGSSSQKDSRAE